MKNVAGKFLLAVLPMLGASVMLAQAQPAKPHGDRSGGAQGQPSSQRGERTGSATTRPAAQTGPRRAAAQVQAPNPPASHQAPARVQRAQPRVEHRPSVNQPPPLGRPHAGRGVPPPVHAQPSPRSHGDRVFGYGHPPRDHGDREGFLWAPGRGGLEGHWAPHHRPSHRHIWIPGHWRGDIWINGHWSLRHRR
jgi:hypothetical protein